jgi:hypothetical protein
MPGSRVCRSRRELLRIRGSAAEFRDTSLTELSGLVLLTGRKELPIQAGFLFRRQEAFHFVRRQRRFLQLGTPAPVRLP